MGEEGDRISWRQLREFADVDLSKSFVLSWHVESEMLVIDIDLFLEPEHPFYERPRPAEKICIRPAAIEFRYCHELQVDDVLSTDLVEITRELRHGAIVDLCVTGEGRYEISGEFGNVSIIAERPVLKLQGP